MLNKKTNADELVAMESVLTHSAQVDLDALRETLASDAGPLVLTLAINRVSGKVSLAQTPMQPGRELADINMLIEVLQKVLAMAQRELVEATVAERVKTPTDVDNCLHLGGHRSTWRCAG